MRCKKCGKKLRAKEKFCTVCGYYNSEEQTDENETNGLLFDDGPNLLEEETLEEYNETSNKNFLKNDVSGTKEDQFYYQEEKLLEAYIGEDYKLIKKSFFNIYAFILNWMYILYRKMYIIGIIGIILTAIIIKINPKYLLVYLGISMIFLGLIFNKLYIFISKKKIEHLTKKYEGTDKFTLENICKQEGGVNISKSLMIYSVFLIFVLINTLNIYLTKESHQKFWDETSENQATCKSLVKTAYKMLEEKPISGTLTEGVCVVSKTSKKEYEVYLKILDNTVTTYLLYKTENDYLFASDNTKDINDLEKKVANNTITKEEKELLDKKRAIEDAYLQATKKSKEEDDLIKADKNTSEKLNFTFSKEAILK